MNSYIILDTSVIIDVIYVYEYMKKIYLMDFHSNTVSQFFKLLERTSKAYLTNAVIILNKKIIEEIKNTSNSRRLFHIKDRLEQFVRIIERDNIKFIKIIDVYDDKLMNSIVNFILTNKYDKDDAHLYYTLEKLISKNGYSSIMVVVDDELTYKGLNQYINVKYSNLRKRVRVYNVVEFLYYLNRMGILADDKFRYLCYFIYRQQKIPFLVLKYCIRENYGRAVDSMQQSLDKFIGKPLLHIDI